MIAGLLIAALSITRAEVADAIRLDQDWRTHPTAPIPATLNRAARLPWPLPPPALEAEVALQFEQLEPSARQAWAADRALVMISGEMAAPSELVASVIKEASAQRTPDVAMRTMEEARQAYANGDMATAASRYDSIRQTSPLWSDAIRERAWTSVRVGDRARALGATVSLAAPYFHKEDQVEARLIAAHVPLSSCRWREARNLVEGLADFTDPPPDETSAADLLDQPHRPTGLEGRAWDDPLVRRTRLALDALSSYGDDARDLGSRVRATADRLLLEAWTAEWQRRRSVAARAVAVLHDAARAERLSLEAGSVITTGVAVDRPPLDDDEVAWPFEGSFWRDELGSYRWLAADHCPREAAP